MCLRTTPGDTGEFHENEGYVQIFDNGKWKNICDADWGITEASILCRQLGHAAVLQFRNSAESSNKVTCTGKEKMFQECNLESQHCNDGVHVTCSPNNPGIQCHTNEYAYNALTLITV